MRAWSTQTLRASLDRYVCSECRLRAEAAYVSGFPPFYKRHFSQNAPSALLQHKKASETVAKAQLSNAPVQDESQQQEKTQTPTTSPSGKTPYRKVSPTQERLVRRAKSVSPRSKGTAIKRVASQSRKRTKSQSSEPLGSKSTAKAQTTVRNFASVDRRARPNDTSTSNFVAVKASDLKFTAVHTKQPPVPTLSHGLERVLFNPGVYQLQDPRSRVFNFDPYLQNIMPLQEFDFSALAEYVTSSEDENLRKIARKHAKTYIGSTSSMTGVLAHFHFLISQWRPLTFSMLSKAFPVESTKFTELLRIPAAIILKYNRGTYAIDADKEFDRGNILQFLGRSMEKLLVLDPPEYEKYRRTNDGRAPPVESGAPESYHYSSLGDFLMRSQLDAYDPRLPGTGMFDLKTRAVVSIRMDVMNPELGCGYQIKDLHGAYESFEREYYDMIRAAFLKYSMQVRIGRMDGIFVAYHNTQRIFGFQYVGLDEMDLAIHGQRDTVLGDQEFAFSVDLLNEALNRATQKFPKTSIRLHFETRDAATPFMYIFAEPITDEQITSIQSANKSALEKFQKSILDGGYDRHRNQADNQSWSQMEASIQQTMHEDALGLDAHRNRTTGDSSESVPKEETEAVGATPTDLEPHSTTSNEGQLPTDVQSDEKPDTQADTPFLAELDEGREGSGQVLAMILSLRNKVNDSYVLRPEKLKGSDGWSVEYSLVDVPDDTRAWSLYQACVNRRRKKQAPPAEENSDDVDFYIQKLRTMSQQGLKWRQSMDEKDSQRRKEVLGEDSSPGRTGSADAE